MLDEAKVKELAANVNELLVNVKQQQETYRKILKLCLTHLEDRRRLIPAGAWEERNQLITALKEYLSEAEKLRSPSEAVGSG